MILIVFQFGYDSLHDIQNNNFPFAGNGMLADILICFIMCEMSHLKGIQ